MKLGKVSRSIRSQQFTLLGLAILLGGCVSSATPNFINGKYYMGGDPNCARYRIISSDRIMCANKNDEETGYRDAMTDQQLQIYMHERQQQDRLLQYQPTHTNCYKTYSGMNCTTY